MVIEKRAIRFKEWGVSIDLYKRPLAAQIADSDGTLPNDEYRLRTNSEGYILTGNNLQNVGQRPKIIGLGGSFVESLYAEEKVRFLSQLERKINDYGMNLEVWNGGYSGATLLHSFNIFMNKVIPALRYTDQVFIFTAMSDQRTLVHSDSYWIRDMTHAPIVEARNGIVSENRLASTEDHERLLTAFIITSRIYNHEPIIVTSPFRAAHFHTDEFTRRLYGDELIYERSLAKLRMINDSARRVAKTHQVKLFDAEAMLEGAPEFFYDSMHLNDAGHSKLSDFLTESYMQHTRETKR